MSAAHPAPATGAKEIGAPETGAGGKPTPRTTPPRAQPAKLISCILPNDGTHLAVLEALFAQGKTNRVFSHSCLGIDIFADAKVSPGTLPDAYLTRVVRVVVAPEEADAMFEYLHEIGKIDRPGGGVILMTPVSAATAYALPDAPPVKEVEEHSDEAADRGAAA